MIAESNHKNVPTRSASLSLADDEPLAMRRTNDSSGETLTLGFMLRAVRHWWIVAAPLGLLLAAGVGFVAWKSTNLIYQADAWLRIAPAKMYIAFKDDPSDSPLFVRTQIATIMSPPVLRVALQQPNVARLDAVQTAESPVDFLSNGLSVRNLGGSELFVVSFQCSDPDEAAEIANAIVAAYLSLQDSASTAQVQHLISLLNDDQEQRKAEVERLRNHVITLAKENAGELVQGESRDVAMVQSTLAGMRSQLISTQVARVVLTAEREAYDSRKEHDPSDIPESVIAGRIAVDPSVLAVKQDMAATEARIAQYLTTSARKEKDPEVIRLRAKHKEDQATLDDLEATLRPQVIEEIQRLFTTDRESRRAEMDAQLRSLDVSEAELNKLVELERLKLADLGGKVVELEFARDELARAEEVHRTIADRITRLQTETQAPARARQHDLATPPLNSTNNPYKFVALGSAGGFCLPFLVAILWELRVRRVDESEEVGRAANLTVIGEIANLPVRSGSSWGWVGRRFTRDRGIFIESINRLRTRLALSDSTREMQVFVVASAVSSEGKTSVASQLAASLAESTGERTLLIDGDLRAPDLHSMFDLQLSPGLAEVLGDGRPPEGVIASCWSDRLHIMPAGRLRSSPHTLLGNGKFEELLGQLRKTYRFIVIDAPPILAASESLVFAAAAEGVLLCTMRSVSRTSQIRLANDLLRAAGAPLLGAVVSGISQRSYASRYGYYGVEAPEVGRDADARPGSGAVTTP